MSSPSLEPLAALLRQRLDIIADHAFRDRDAAAHLDALRQVSEDLATMHESMRSQLPPRLRHFLQQASYSKALLYIESGGQSE